MLWSLALVPTAAGGLLWLALAGGRAGARVRVIAGALGAAALVALLGLAARAAVLAPEASFGWGAGLSLRLTTGGVATVAAVLVPVISLPVVVWAAAHEQREGLPRLVGLLVAFTGSMELLVLAADLLTLLIGWELVTAFSWALIGHHWREEEAASGAVYAFNATRIGGLGLLVAAGAALAATGSFSYAALERMTGGWRDLMVLGLLLAAASKAAQVPFSPWLYRAMIGPSSVSSLLHSSTMVAAGAYLLVRLHAPLAAAPWFGTAAITVGLVTAWAGGFAAAVQPHAKRLLAASTSAQFGFVFVAVGAGSAAAGMAQIVTHAAYKSLLFLAAGTAMGAAGSAALRRMRLGRAMPAVAAASGVGALALAALPPLGGAWSKEQVVDAAGGQAWWLAALTIGAGALSAWYAARFQLLAYGAPRPTLPSVSTPPGPSRRGRPTTGEPTLGTGAPGGAVVAALWFLAGLSLLLGLLWLPGAGNIVDQVLGGGLAATAHWEPPVSIFVVVAALLAAWVCDRRGCLAGPEEPAGTRRTIAEWTGLSAAIQAAVIAPTLRLASLCAAVDDRVVDGAVRALARLGLRAASAGRTGDDEGVDAVVRAFAALLGRAGRRARTLQTGATPTYYLIATVGLAAIVAILVLGR